MSDQLIHILGPGGAGKSRIGSALAERLRVTFVDLDQQFAVGVEGISDCIDSRGHEAYAKRNVDLYCELAREVGRRRVLALSSGFMKYPLAIHPQYGRCREDIVGSRTTMVLVPMRPVDEVCDELVGALAAPMAPDRSGLPRGGEALIRNMD